MIIIENGVQAVDDGSNNWDDGSGTGNFWSDYGGTDSDGDGIGDSPYGGLDNYPIIEPNMNVPPVADIIGPLVNNEGTAIDFDASGTTDYNDGSELLYRWDFDNDGVWDTEYSSNPTISHTYFDDYADVAVVEVFDGELTDTATTPVTISNVAPDVEISFGPTDPVMLGTSIDISASFTDPGTADTHTATIDWGDGTVEEVAVTEDGGSGTLADSHTYATTGVFAITVTVTDDDEGTDSAVFRYAVIYDPDGGFVTGGGWIYSPAGAYIPDPDAEGKASFGFVSKFKKGTTTPTGNTEFQFHAADLNFHSDNYEWLVVAGSKAMFKGEGTINGQGSYKFILTAVDGDLQGGGGGVDRFRIKIWIEDEITAEETLIYNNMVGAEDDEELGPTTELGGGQIVIHKG